MNSLELKYEWGELADLTAGRVGKRLNIKKWNEEEFKNWFMIRKKVGYRFDWVLVARAYNIWKELQKESDHFTVVVGKEGVGKSTIAAQLCSWVSPNFSLDDICYNIHQFLGKLREIAANYNLNRIDNEDKSILIDEGAIDLFSREAMKRSNRILAKTFMIQRFLKVHVVICIPKFKYLDSIVRDHRINTLISIKKRGVYKCITGKGISIVNKQLKRDKEINQMQIPYGSFWEGTFSKRFPKTLDFGKYEELKFINIKGFLKDAEEEAMAIKMVKVARVAAELGVTNDTLINAIKRGEIEGKQIAHQWFITKKAYEKLLTP